MGRGGGICVRDRGEHSRRVPGEKRRDEVRRVKYASNGHAGQQNETMRTALVEVTAFNSIIPIPAFTLPASEQTSEVSETSEVSPAPEANFGGTVNVIPAEQSSTT